MTPRIMFTHACFPFSFSGNEIGNEKGNPKTRNDGNDHFLKSILLMIFTSPFSTLFKGHLFQHLPNFKNHRFLEVLIFNIPLNSFQSPLEFVTPISRLPTHCRRVFMVRRQHSPLPLEARLPKRSLFKFESFPDSQVPIRFCFYFTSVCETRKCMDSHCF